MQSVVASTPHPDTFISSREPGAKFSVDLIFIFHLPPRYDMLSPTPCRPSPSVVRARLARGSRGGTGPNTV